MLYNVTAFAPLPEGRLFVKLDTGESGLFDMRPYMKSDFFAQLKNDAYFRRACIEYGVISWPNGQDISPATVRMEMENRDCPDGMELRYETSLNTPEK